MATHRLFGEPPLIEFRPSHSHCSDCQQALKAQKSHTRMVSTLHIGKFRARATIRACPKCDRVYRSEELGRLVPPGANFGYDVLVYAGKALWLRCRGEDEVVAELAQKNVLISPREVSLLGMKFIVYLAIAHHRRAPDIMAGMRTRGGYICHLDATCEGRDPLPMSSIDALSEIILGSVKLPAENEEHIAPFLERIKNTFGIPLALVHDMGKGILKAVKRVFPDVPDYVCHFHFLRDIGKDFLGGEYDTIRRQLRKHGITAGLRWRARQFKDAIDRNPELINALQSVITNALLPDQACPSLPVINAYTLIHWALQGKSEGNGYGFPFDHPHPAFAKRIRVLHAEAEKLQPIQLRGEWKDTIPYFKIHTTLKAVMKDRTLWDAVDALEAKTFVFEKLRAAMRIAPQSGRHGLNDDGQKGNIRAIEQRVNAFCAWVTSRKEYPRNRADQKTIEQIDKYKAKLFAEPISVQTPSGAILIQPQRTNNILERFFRDLKRANRRKTGNASAGRMLRAILAETPLVRNLENPDYMKILLNGKTSLEDLFAETDIVTLRKEFIKAQSDPEKILAKLKPLISMPEKLVEMIQKAVA